jgi:mannosidase alpha-like ER degradation enhancer 1/mannosidase alpha-like ER degradation enhancer 2
MNILSIKKGFLVLMLGFFIPSTFAQVAYNEQAQDVINETVRSWNSYKKYAWGHDVYLPLTHSFSDWYSEPLYISPIDAYSTLYLMGLHDETAEIERYVIDSLDFNKNIFVKTFEVNIRILGGLLSMYDLTQNPEILKKAIDFGNRILPAFNTLTGIPTYWVNLQTGETKGDTVNIAEAGTYLIEMGVLSYYTQDPKYYQAAKKAIKAVHYSSSSLGLIGDVIQVQNGKWISFQSHICAGVDSYYEYIYKAYLLFGDPELKTIWDNSIPGIQKYLADIYENKLWFGRAHMYSGEKTSSVITLYDAFFPALLALSGNISDARYLQKTWNWVWDRYGLEPMSYDYKKKEVKYPVYDLNPEIMESAYYLYHFTKDSLYYNMNVKYWNNIKKYCRTEDAYTAIENIKTMKQGNEMATYFFAETLKYLFLTFSYHENQFPFDDYIFSTEAHPFKRAHFNNPETPTYLGFK